MIDREWDVSFIANFLDSVPVNDVLILVLYQSEEYESSFLIHDAYGTNLRAGCSVWFYCDNGASSGQLSDFFYLQGITMNTINNEYNQS